MTESAYTTGAYSPYQKYEGSSFRQTIIMTLNNYIINVCNN